jgi:4-hydroxybenzoate polyprenyltransferase
VTAVGFLSLLTYGGMLNNQGFPFYASVALASVMLLPALLRTDIDRPSDCKDLFLGTPLLGQIILAGLVADAVFHRFTEGIAF